MNPDLVRQWRTLLILGRVSNLPTVWSNCLAGWWLGGGGTIWKLPPLLLGVSALYTGGMFLNDAFDVDFDRQRRSARPIPSGAISSAAVWRWGWLWLALGVLGLLIPGKATGALGAVLALCIVIYNATHKAITASPWLMGLCRFWVYVIAGSTGAWGLTGDPIWCGLALALYVVGLSYVARREGSRTPVDRWPLALLAAPLLLALLMDSHQARLTGLALSVILALWLLRCLWAVLWGESHNVRHTVSGLLAGIVLVDWLAIAPAVAPDPHRLLAVSAVVLLLFGGTLWSQRFVPAT